MKKLIGLFLLPSILSFGQATKPQKVELKTPKSDWKTFAKDSISIQYPPNWELNDKGIMGTMAFLFSPMDSTTDFFRENVNLLVQDLGHLNIDLNKYIEVTENQIKTMVTNGQLIESKRLKKDAMEFHKIIYSGDQGIYKLKYKQYYFIQNEKAYVLTLSTLMDSFDKFKDVGEKIMDTFKFK
jgi:hypothetical protein